MVAETPSRGSRLFPEICIQLRPGDRSSQIVLPPAAQVAGILVLVAIAVALCYLGISRIGHDRLVAGKEEAVVRAETANADLQDELVRVRDKLAGAVRDREQAEARLSALASQADSARGLGSQQRGDIQQQPTASAEAAASKTGRIGQLTQVLEQTQRELHRVETERASLATRLSKIEADQPVGHGRHKATLEAATKRLQQVSADRDKAIVERDRLRARIAELEQKHSQREIREPDGSGLVLRLAGLITTELAEPEADPPRPEALLTDAPPEPQPESLSVSEISRRIFSEFSRALASTGLNAERLFPQIGLQRAEGGPFVPPPKADQPSGMSPDKLEAMRSLIKSLPLTPPLDHFQLESRFGPRRDPFNRRLSFHSGIDLSAPYMSPIYATAAGIVTYAGYRADYGKVVEIDHGNGIATVYGHLHRAIVSVGQRVAEGTQIGLLGSTGRSSGPHVHYEILVNGEFQDPEKFFGLARLIPVAER
jgi:murein DD-endopeptidase MepM/ murein hydrolase activator NlpD